MNIIKWLFITEQYTEMYLNRKLAPLGINGSQYMYVLKVYEEPEISQTDLIEHFYFNPSNITRAINYLNAIYA